MVIGRPILKFVLLGSRFPKCELYVGYCPDPLTVGYKQKYICRKALVFSVLCCSGCGPYQEVPESLRASSLHENASYSFCDVSSISAYMKGWGFAGCGQLSTHILTALQYHTEALRWAPKIDGLLYSLKQLLRRRFNWSANTVPLEL